MTARILFRSFLTSKLHGLHHHHRFFTVSPPPPVLTHTSLVLFDHWAIELATIRMRAEAAATSDSPPLPPPFILSPTRPDAPPPLPTSVPTSFPPLSLPTDSHREGRPEVNLPPRMVIMITDLLPLKDRKVRRTLRGTWIWDYRFKTEAAVQEAWRRAMDSSDLAHGGVISSTTIVNAQWKRHRVTISDRRRQRAMSTQIVSDLDCKQHYRGDGSTTGTRDSREHGGPCTDGAAADAGSILRLDSLWLLMICIEANISITGFYPASKA
ncbi:hypothetical protein Tco_1183017 [Tanacetum coccineum]